MVNLKVHSTWATYFVTVWFFYDPYLILVRLSSTSTGTISVQVGDSKLTGNVVRLPLGSASRVTEQ